MKIQLVTDDGELIGTWERVEYKGNLLDSFTQIPGEINRYVISNPKSTKTLTKEK